MLDTVYYLIADEGHIVLPAVLLASWYGTMAATLLTDADPFSG